MKIMIDFFLERSLIVNIFTLTIVALGSLYAWNLQKEIFPRVDFGVINVTISYPGSSAEDVERRVIIPMERELKGISGINDMNSLSQEGRGRIIITVEQDATLNDVLDDIKNTVDQVNDLPESVESPNVTSLNNKDQQIISIVLTGEDYGLIKETAKDLKDDLERMSEMRRVSLGGYLPDEIRLEISPAELAHYEITAKDIVDAIRKRNRSIPAGKMETPRGTLFIRVNAEFESLEDVKNVVIRSNSSGENVKISDIARVTRKPNDTSVRYRANGKKAVFLDAVIKDSADIIKSTKKLKIRVQQFFENDSHLNKKITYHYVNEAANWVKRRMNVLIDNGIMGFVLVFVCLLLFLNTRTSIITCLGAPIAFMMSFIGMSMLGITLNMISMFSLILVLGMLVDDSIIVAEYYFQKLEQGLSPKEAARQAALDTIKPISVTIFTSMIAFASFFFVTGTMGKFIWSIPAVVLICLLASLLECYFILPSHLCDFVRIKPLNKNPAWYSSMLNFYRRTLDKALKYYWAVVIFFIVLLLATLWITTTMKFKLFPGDDVRTVFLQIKGNLGNTLERTDKIMAKMEKIVLKELPPQELEQISARIGVLIEQRRKKTAPHYGSLVLHLTSPQDRDRNTDEIIKNLSQKFKPILEEYILTSRKLKGGPPSGKPVDIELSGGDNINQLFEVSQKVERELKKIKGILTTEIDFEEGKKQLSIKVKEEEVRRLGLTTQDVALELRRIYSNESFDIKREEDEDIDIKLFLDEQSRNNIETLNQLYITNKQNRRIPLLRLVETHEEPMAFVIRRKNTKRIISVTAQINSDIITPIEISRQLTPVVDKILQDYPTVKRYFGGENKETNDSMASMLRAFLLSICFIFIVLIGLFGTIRHTLVVMSAIPFGMIGVVLTFKIAGQPLSFMAMLGIVALVGVVINDSIVLVNFINKIRLQEGSLHKAVLDGAVSRYRAIILTTITTAAGLLFLAHPPLAKIVSFGLNKDSDPFLQPMAMSFAWGLIFASSITLLFVPALYISLEKLTGFLSNICKKYFLPRFSP